MPKIAFFSAHEYERDYFDKSNREYNHVITYFETQLSEKTAPLAKGHEVICASVNDRLDKKTLTILASCGVKLIALRSSGFNNIDLIAANQLNLPVVRVPEYSPNAVAEHAVALILALNRKICRADSRIKTGNFSLNGLVGFDLKGKTIGIIGTGRIGTVMAQIMTGFGCRILAYDLYPNPDLKLVSYVKDINELYKQSDIVSLHVPMTPANYHMINMPAINRMKHGVMLINVSRGALIDTTALITALKAGKIGSAGLDVYEEEEHYFYHDLSNRVILDDHLARLMTFPNVIITSHQAFLTQEALSQIAKTTLESIKDFELNKPLTNQVSVEKIASMPEKKAQEKNFKKDQQNKGSSVSDERSLTPRARL